MILLDYLKANSIPKYRAAKELKVAWTTIWRWCLPAGDKRRAIPQADQMRRIQTWSDGQVTPNDFVKPERVAS